MFGFCKTFNKINKTLGFPIIFKTADLQDIIYTIIGDAINISNKYFYLYVPSFFLSPETQAMFNESIKNFYRISYDFRTSERKVVDDGLELQVDLRSAQNINSSKYLIEAHQTTKKMRGPDKANNIAIFDNLDVRKYFCKIEGQLDPKDSFMINYTKKDYIDHNRDLKLFYKEYVGEELLNPFITYLETKFSHPVQLFDLRFQLDHIKLPKLKIFDEYRNNSDNARLFIILVRHRQIEMTTDGNKITEIKFI